MEPAISWGSVAASTDNTRRSFTVQVKAWRWAGSLHAPPVGTLVLGPFQLRTQTPCWEKVKCVRGQRSTAPAWLPAHK